MDANDGSYISQRHSQRSSHRVHVPSAPRVTIHEFEGSVYHAPCIRNTQSQIKFHLFQNVTTMQQFYRFLHFLVTLIFSLLISLQYYFKLTKRKIRGIFYNSTEYDIINGVATLKNLPRHLTFIVMEKNIDLCILARIVVWSVTAGISYISIQASEGKTKRRIQLYFIHCINYYLISKNMIGSNNYKSSMKYITHFIDNPSIYYAIILMYKIIYR